MRVVAHSPKQTAKNWGEQNPRLVDIIWRLVSPETGLLLQRAYQRSALCLWFDITDVGASDSDDANAQIAHCTRLHSDHAGNRSFRYGTIMMALLTGR